MKIAIIEDDKITRLELSKLLNSHGYETVLLTDFENLSEESKKYSFDLILLDINLPYENGYEICRKMKKLMSVPIIFVTSRDTSADELLSIQAGGIDFITKPYDTLISWRKSNGHFNYQIRIISGNLQKKTALSIFICPY